MSATTTTASPPLPATGLHPRVPYRVYRDWPAASYSRLKHGDGESGTASKIRHAMQSPPESSPALREGAAMHIMVFEPSRASEILAEKVERRSAAGKARAEELAAMNAIVIDPDRLDELRAWADAVRSHPAARSLLECPGECELSAIWTDAGHGCRVKGRIDRLTDGLIVDLKTCATGAGPRAWRRSIERYSYDLQAAMYVEAVRATTGQRCEFAWIVAEKDPPYDVAVYAADASVLASGTARYRRTLAMYAEGVRSGRWPGYAETIEPVGVSTWRLDGIEVDLTETVDD